MNICILIGRLTREAEMRTTINGTIVTTFSLAVNRNYKDESGAIVTDFINCKAFNKTGETIAKYTKKGSLIAVHGNMQTSNYEAQDGTKRYLTEIVVNEFKFLDKKEKTDSQIIQDVMNDDFDDFDMPF